MTQQFHFRVFIQRKQKYIHIPNHYVVYLKLMCYIQLYPNNKIVNTPYSCRSLMIWPITILPAFVWTSIHPPNPRSYIIPVLDYMFLESPCLFVHPHLLPCYSYIRKYPLIPSCHSENVHPSRAWGWPLDWEHDGSWLLCSAPPWDIAAHTDLQSTCFIVFTDFYTCLLPQIEKLHSSWYLINTQINNCFTKWLSEWMIQDPLSFFLPTFV